MLSFKRLLQIMPMFEYSFFHRAKYGRGKFTEPCVVRADISSDFPSYNRSVMCDHGIMIDTLVHLDSGVNIGCVVRDDRFNSESL